MPVFDLENRLVNYASAVIDIVEQLPPKFVCTHLGKQLIRSSTGAALNYGEAQAAESSADFIHKLKISLKELKESQISLKILSKRIYIEEKKILPIIQETSELVAIFTTSIKTARRKSQKP